MTQVIRPTYVREFVCDGKFCGSRCCRDWRIALDEETRENFLRLPDDEREKFFQHVTSDESAQFFQMKPSGACPFLGENFLCSLQLEHGEDFLPAICQSFPRVTYKLSDEIFLQAMTLTCPVTAIKILLNVNPITFEAVDELKSRQIFDFTKKLSIPVLKFLTAQRVAIEILQRRELSINRRLQILCEFFGEKSPVPVDFDAQSNAAALAEIFGETYDANLTVDKKNQLVDSYLVARENILIQLREKFSVVLENYLVNEFFMRCYPCAFVGDEKFNCRVFVTSFRAVEFAAVLTTISHGGLTVEDFLNLLCALNDKLDHSRGGMTAIKNFAELHDAEIFAALMLDD